MTRCKAAMVLCAFLFGALLSDCAGGGETAGAGRNVVWDRLPDPPRTERAKP